MKYFTPKLYRLGNTPSSAIYENFDLIWDRKIKDYHKYLLSIKPNTPSEVMRLARKICLYGGEIVGVTKTSVTVWLDEVLYVIEFELDADTPQPRHRPALSGHPFDSSGHAWLYDELEMLSPGVFLFEIMLSDGRILRFRFRNVIISDSRPKLTLSKLQELVFFPAYRARHEVRKARKKKFDAAATPKQTLQKATK